MNTLCRASMLVVLGSLGLSGCNKDSAKPAPATAPASASAGAARPAQASADGARGGTVLETMNAGGYTYAKLDAGGTQVWVAGPQTQLAVGHRVDVNGGELMENFHSKTLGRTFPKIYFISSFAGGGAPTGHGGAAVAGHGGAHAAAPTAVGTIDVPAGATRVVDLFANKATLADKPVTVRGNVVKFNAGIMGRNWIHLQDGSGSGAEGTNDVTVTTSGTATVGDVVTVTGKLATDKDFGGGYKYVLVIEDATVEAK